MAKLSRDEIASLARSAGFSGGDVPIAVAVALAESGGDPKSHNPTPPDNSYGLWQINMLGSMGPDRRKRFGIASNDALYDPATNARAAYSIWKESGWKAWTTYTRGTYKKYLDSNDTGSASPATSTSGGPGLDPVGSAINAFGDTIFKGFANIAGILVAIALIVIGAVFLLRNVIPVGKVASVAKKVASGVSTE